MPKLLVLITTRIEKGLEVAQAWEEVGAPGVTLIESQGLRRLRERSKTLELPLFVSLAQVMHETEESNQTLLTVVDEALIDPLMQAAYRVLETDTLDRPGSGVAFVIDVERVFGIPGTGRTPKQP